LLDFNVLVICAKSMITKEPHKFYVGGGVGCLIQVKKIHLFFIRIPFFV
jgi:hypothetical protein